MMKEFCIDIEVGELSPFSSCEVVCAEVPSIEGFLVGDLANIEELGEPAPMVALLEGDALPPFLVGLPP